MEKLGIFFAVTATSLLGMAGTASAQEPPVNTIKSAGCPIDAATAGVDPDGQCEGFEAPSQDMAGFNSYLCGIADGIDADAEANGQPAPNDLSDGVRSVAEGNPVEAGDCSGGDDDETDGDDDDDTNGGNEDDVVAAAKQQSAGADGTLPRTGGFSVAGFGLVSIGALVRRLIA